MTIAMISEDTAHRIDHSEHLLRFDKKFKQVRHFRRGAKPATYLDSITELPVTCDGPFQRKEREAIDIRLRAMDAAPGDADLVLPREVREIAVIGEEARDLEKL